MLSKRMVQPGFSSPVRTRPSSTCSLKAITRSVSLPPLVMRFEPSRIRLPLPPATLRAGGRISAGIISTVHTPRPICEAMAPKVWPQRCAPSPESLTISTMCSLNVTGAAFLAVASGEAAARGFAAGAHRLDDGGGARDDVATGKDACHRSSEILIGVDVAALVETQLRGLSDDRIGVGADREHNLITIKFIFATLYRDWTPAP